MTAPKVTVVVLDADGEWWPWNVNGDTVDILPTRSRLHARLAESGQVLDIPADAAPGWFGVPTDKPKLPHGEWWGNVNQGIREDKGTLYIHWYRVHPGNVKRVALLRLWIDDDGPHVEVVE